MKWVWIIAGILAGTVLLITLIGLLLPRKHTVYRTISFNHPPEDLWPLIAGPQTWRPEVRQYEQLPPINSHQSWRETDKYGKKITFEAMESLPPSRRVVRIADHNLSFGGTWIYTITPTAHGCSLTITEDGEVYNPIFRFVSRFIIGHSASIDAYLKALSAKLS